MDTIKNKIRNLKRLAFTNSVARKTLAKKEVQSIIRQRKKIGNDVDHYSDKYWNNLDLVQKYICKNSTDDDRIIWQIDALNRFKDKIPFSECLVIGCGNGWVERQLYDLGIGKHFDAFDISEKYLETAEKEKEGRNITYFIDDINNLEKLHKNKYDAVFNVGVLHHTFRMTKALWQILQSLKLDGLLFNYEYVGPAQNQYSDEHLKIMQRINESLPERFRTKYDLRPPKEAFALGDPSEAVNADLVKPTIERFFDIAYQRNLNGGIAYQILWNNIDEFNKNDELSAKTLKYLIKKDEELTDGKKIPVLFWYSVCKPKRKESIRNFDLLPSK